MTLGQQINLRELETLNEAFWRKKSISILITRHSCIPENNRVLTNIDSSWDQLLLLGI